MEGLDGLASFWLFLCFVVWFLFPFSNGKFLQIFLMYSGGSSYRNGNSFWLCASKQEVDHTEGAIPLTSGKDGVAGFFFLLLPLLGIHRCSASCSVCWKIWHLGVWPVRLKGAERRSSPVPSQTYDSSVLSDCDWWKGSIKLSEGRKTMTSI